MLRILVLAMAIVACEREKDTPAPPSATALAKVNKSSPIALPTEIEIPRSDKQSQELLNSLMVSVTAEAVFVNGKQIATLQSGRVDDSTKQSMLDALKETFSKRANKRAVLMADQDLDYGAVIAVVDVTKRAGASHISLATAPK